MRADDCQVQLSTILITTKSGQRSHTSDSFYNTELIFTIPLSLLDSDGAMDLVLIAGNNYGPNLDKVPNIGVYNIAKGKLWSIKNQLRTST